MRLTRMNALSNVYFHFHAMFRPLLVFRGGEKSLGVYQENVYDLIQPS